MDVGIQLIFQNTHEGMSDADMFRAETDLAINAEKAGFDYVMAPEHHFDPGYSMMPDNMQFAAHLLARTSRIKVGTGAIILPWWPNPLRVAEKISMLDILGEGRFLLGFGRGLARQEYETWGVDMAEARGRFDQAAEIILDILDTGIAEYDTEFFQQTRTEIHPKPERGFRDREFFSVAMTPDSGTAAADLGGTMMSFVQLPIEQHAEAIEAWRARWREVRPSVEPGAPLLTDFTYCHEDAEVAEEVAREYLTKYYLSVIRHYDFDGDHWGKTSGYQAYQGGADAIKEAGLEAACEGFIASQCWGTPDQMVEKYQQRFDLIGDLRCSMAVSYAGLPFDMCRASMDLIGERVIPRLHAISKSPAAV